MPETPTQTPAFTPGPWSTFGIGYKRYPGVDGEDGGYSVIVFGTDDEPDMGVQGRTQEEAKANAHLIAAAPDLYAALKAVRVVLKMEAAMSANEAAWLQFIEEQLEPALAKAEGR